MYIALLAVSMGQPHVYKPMYNWHMADIFKNTLNAHTKLPLELSS